MAKKGQRGKYGENMIRFSVKFFTNNLPKGTDERTAWQGGAITLLKNESKGLKPDMVFFRSLDEFTTKFQELLDKNKVTLIDRPPKERFIKKKF